MAHATRFSGLLNDDIGKSRIRSDRLPVIQRAPPNLMRIFAEDVHASALDSEQFRYVFVTVQAVRDKKWNHDYILRIGQLVPLRDQWWLFHVCIQNGSEFAARTNSFRFPFGRDRAV